MNYTQRRVSRRVVFAAAHSIQGAGKCANKHGHNWLANITVDQINGPLDPRGFIVDVRDLKMSAFKYDHDDLDKYFKFPSTENVAQQIAEDALQICVENNSEGTFIVNVHLVETEDNSADASASNFTATLPTVETHQAVDFEELKRKALEAEAAYASGVNPGAGLSPKAKFVKRAK